jgi:hypothetical protein
MRNHLDHRIVRAEHPLFFFCCLDGPEDREPLGWSLSLRVTDGSMLPSDQVSRL